MKELEKTIDELIHQNKNDLLNSHLNYGGVYLSKIEMDNGTSIEVELDEGTIAFTLLVDNKSCANCGSKEFSANQVVRANIIVDFQNNFLRNSANSLEDSVYEADNPFGPYSCCNCGEEFDEICDLEKNIENVFDLLNEKLRLNGIGVYTNYDDFEKALSKD
jgi:hypothetical protein